MNRKEKIVVVLGIMYVLIMLSVLSIILSMSNTIIHPSWMVNV